MARATLSSNLLNGKLNLERKVIKTRLIETKIRFSLFFVVRVVVRLGFTVIKRSDAKSHTYIYHQL